MVPEGSRLVIARIDQDPAALRQRKGAAARHNRDWQGDQSPMHLNLRLIAAHLSEAKGSDSACIVAQTRL